VPRGPKPPTFNVQDQRKTDTNEWWWFDAMHYRKTGKLARHLLEKTTPDSPLHLYAIGYLTHVAADTVGHPYVNSISGGPYRSHAQRHKGSENYQDVFNFLAVRGTDWNHSALHAFYNFNFTGAIDTPNDVPDPFTNLPADLAQLIADALNDLYQEDAAPPHPDYAKRVTPADINDAYRLWYRWLKSATDTGTLPPPVPYSLTAELREVWDQVVDNLGDIGDFLEDAADSAGDLGIWGIFLLLGALILAALAAAAALIDAVLGALTTLGSATIRYVACLIYEQLYNAYETFRLAVAMNGLAFPMQEHLSDPRITHWANPDLPDANGNSVTSILGRLPALKWTLPGLNLTHNERHLVYPPTGPELSTIFAVPTSYLDKTSTWYAWGDIPQHPGVLDELLNLTGDDGTKLAGLLDDKRLLGNALDLTEAMYDQVKGMGSLPDFNLDGDRGYGYLCWMQANDPAPDFPNPIVVAANPTAVVQLNFIG
jgi:Zinc dependent phospholipase C